MRISRGSSCRLSVAAFLLSAAVACGHKGPPLPPLPRVPAAVADMTASRVGDDVYLTFTVPGTNIDGAKPPDIAALEIYAVTAMTPPETEAQRKVATLLTTLPVRPLVPAPEPLPDGTAPPAVPLPPGLDINAKAAFRESLNESSRIVVELPPKPGAPKPVEPKEEEEVTDEWTELPSLPLVMPPPEKQPHRFYFIVGVSPRGRKGPPSNVLAVPLDPPLAAPSVPEATYTEKAMTLSWKPSADARTASLEPPKPPVVTPVVPPPPVVPPDPDAPPANVTPPTPPPPPEPPVLAAKSLGFNIVATTYQVYEVPKEAPPEDPLAIQLPIPLTPAPLTTTEFALPGPVTFGVERCFVVRALDTLENGTALSKESPAGCVTPKDTFPPVVPRNLGAIASTGQINLIWDANAESDLAGYLVLRGEAPGATLRAITPSPVKANSYRDSDVKPGVRYVYVVVAVDTADPQNVSGQSNRVEETAR